MDHIITREQAITLGLKRYYTGEPCVNGHLSERYVNGYFCIACIRGSMESTSGGNERRDALVEQKLENERIKLELRAERIRIDAERLALRQQIREQREATKEARAAESERRAKYRVNANRPDLQPIRVMIDHFDLKYVQDELLAKSQTIDPDITLADILTKKTPETYGPIATHTFRVFPELRDWLNTLVKSTDNARKNHAANQAAYHAEMDRRRAIWAAERAAAEDDNGRPEWTGGPLN